jgi:transposase
VTLSLYQRSNILTQWWKANQTRFAQVKTLVLNLDNGPENHSRRTQFLHRLVGFAHQTGLTIQLAYYPPYHSKYNPIERCWGVLENHWNGDLLDTVETLVHFAQTMTWKGKHPTVELITKT